jgi:hypothetical protein
MSQSCGVAGAYGIPLANIEQKDFPEVFELREKLRQYLDDGDKNGTWMDKGFNSPDQDPKVKRFRKQFIAAFQLRKVNVPSGVLLHHTGDEDDRPAKGCDPADEWVLGFGLFTTPGSYPKMARSFTRLAVWYTWVWMG